MERILNGHGILLQARVEVEPVLRGLVDTLPEESRKIAAYHFGWQSPEGAPRRAGTGKAFRPAMTLAAARATDADPEQALTAAAAVELVHNSTLIHDDIIDQDVMRHGQDTVWKVFGIPEALVVGDSLLALGLRALTQLGCSCGTAVALLADAMIEVCEGEIAESKFESDSNVTLNDCLKMAERKSSGLVRGAFAIGAALGTADNAIIQEFADFGTQLGIAYQIGNDLLGIWGDPDKTGKPAGRDLATLKKSLPVIAALNSDTQAGRQLQEIYSRQQHLTEEQARNAADLVEQAGALKWAQAEVARITQIATRHLELAIPDPDRGSELQCFVDLATTHFEDYSGILLGGKYGNGQC
jgi:geranylgeranyl diphosphate synthase, type I